METQPKLQNNNEKGAISPELNNLVSSLLNRLKGPGKRGGPNSMANVQADFDLEVLEMFVDEINVPINIFNPELPKDLEGDVKKFIDSFYKVAILRKVSPLSLTEEAILYAAVGLEVPTALKSVDHGISTTLSSEDIPVGSVEKEKRRPK